MASRVLPTIRYSGTRPRPGVVDSHGSVLQAHCGMYDRQHRFAFHLCITMRDSDRRLFMATSDQFRRFVPAVVDDRLVQPPPRLARVTGHILEAHPLEDVDHEVCAGACDRENARWRNWVNFRGRHRRFCNRLRNGLLRSQRSRCRNQRRDAAHSCARDKFSAINQVILGFGHGRNHLRRSMNAGNITQMSALGRVHTSPTLELLETGDLAQ